MKKVLVPEKSVMSMYDFLVNYGQVEEKVAFRYCNFPHERIKEVVYGMQIERFPMDYYQDEYAIRGVVLWVCDRSGKKLPYINPLLLGNISAQEIIVRLIMGMDLELLLAGLLRRTDIPVIPVSKIPENIGYTRKKSRQKTIDKKRKEWFE